jgi:hypothetical protein
MNWIRSGREMVAWVKGKVAVGCRGLGGQGFGVQGLWERGEKRKRGPYTVPVFRENGL